VVVETTLSTVNDCHVDFPSTGANEKLGLGPCSILRRSAEVSGRHTTHLRRTGHGPAHCGQPAGDGPSVTLRWAVTERRARGLSFLWRKSNRHFLRGLKNLGRKRDACRANAEECSLWRKANAAKNCARRKLKRRAVLYAARDLRQVLQLNSALSPSVTRLSTVPPFSLLLLALGTRSRPPPVATSNDRSTSSSGEEALWRVDWLTSWSYKASRISTRPGIKPVKATQTRSHQLLKWLAVILCDRVFSWHKSQRFSCFRCPRPVRNSFTTFAVSCSIFLFM